MAVHVLEQRREKNPVASIILLSDGRDNQNGNGAEFLQSLGNLPPCIRANAQSSTLTDVVPIPVHTFGFGSKHESTALHAIADGSGGTFSYIESIEIIQDAFAQCIGGLLSVVAQEVEIHVRSGPSSVYILSISSGRYRNTIRNYANQRGVVHVGDAYAEEEKKFLVNDLSISQASASSSEETDTLATKLLEVKYSYKDPICNESIMSETVIVEIRRPPTNNLSEADRQVCLEVDRVRNRISIAEGIEQAQVMADRGEFEGARALLERRRGIIKESFSVKKDRGRRHDWEREMRKIALGMSSKVEYEGGGKAYAYSKRRSHNYHQRASTQAVVTKLEQVSISGAPPKDGADYQTSVKRKMVKKSKELRQSCDQGAQSGESSYSNQPVLE